MPPEQDFTNTCHYYCALALIEVSTKCYPVGVDKGVVLTNTFYVLPNTDNHLLPIQWQVWQCLD